MEIAIVIHNGERVIEEFSSLVNPETKIDPFVVALTGISDEMVEDAPTFAQLAPEILSLTKNRIFVAHNAHFDYGFLRNEFSRLGIRFQRPNLCTVKMSQKLLPGYASYSLGKLCQDLDIPIKNRHRALGDAAATAVLLEKMLFSEKKHLIDDLLQSELESANLPPHLSLQELDELPEDTGVYYFKNKKGQPIYIGKSKNIRKRVIQHFQKESQSRRFSDLKKNTYSIDFQLTGSELIAELVESGEIKRFMPEYNRAQKRKKYRYGIFARDDENGYLRLHSQLLHPDEKPLLSFTTKKWAERALSDLRNDNQLIQKTRQSETVELYNQRVYTAIESFVFPAPNLLIIGYGRNYFEKSVIQIQDGSYVGFGYFSTEEQIIDSPEDIIACIKPDYNHPNKEQIIRKYLRKPKGIQVIHYQSESYISA